MTIDGDQKHLSSPVASPKKVHPKLVKDRQYRAVRLTLEEAYYIENRVDQAVPFCWCGHLNMFHRTGRTSSGIEWTTCELWPCDCYIEEQGELPPPPLQPTTGLHWTQILGLMGIEAIILIAILSVVFRQ